MVGRAHPTVCPRLKRQLVKSAAVGWALPTTLPQFGTAGKSFHQGRRVVHALALPIAGKDGGQSPPYSLPAAQAPTRQVSSRRVGSAHRLTAIRNGRKIVPPRATGRTCFGVANSGNRWWAEPTLQSGFASQ